VVFLPLSFILTLKIIYVKIFSEVKNMTEINIKKALNQNSQLLEEKVLKAIFKRNDIIVETLDIINPSMFAMPSYASIYSAMLSLYKSNSAINDESVQIWLESNGLSVEPNLIKKLYNESYSRLKVRETCEMTNITPEQAAENVITAVTNLK
jgi:replicative DNA helicase